MTNDDLSSRETDSLEYVFLAIFTLEALLKIIATGFLFCGPPSYLRNKWNILDFIIVAVGLIGVVVEQSGSSVADVKALRALRVLRPLRLITSVQSLQIVLNSILLSIPALADVAMLLGFLIVIYAIIGLEFYRGVLNHQCFLPSSDVGANVTADRYINNTPYFLAPDTAPCDPAGRGRVCSTDGLCLAGSSPNSNITAFDHAGSFLKFDAAESMAEHEQNFFNSSAGADGNDGDDDDDDIDDDATTVLVLGLSLPSGNRDFVEAEPTEPISNIRTRIMQKFAEQGEDRDKLMSFVLAHPHDGHILDETRTLGEQGVQVKSLREYNEILTMSQHNQHELLKPATVQMLSKLGAVVKSRWFNLVVTFMVLVNTVLLAVQTDAGATDEAAFAFTIVEASFVGLFVLEMLVKLAGLRPHMYFESKFNRFDLTVVLLSLLELILVHTTGLRSIGISALRSLRLLRIFREMKQYWEDINDFVVSLLNSIASIVSLLLLILIYMVIVALLGMQIFGGRFDFEDPKPRINFDDFFSALLTVFIVIVGDDWNSVMYNGILAYNGVNKDGWVAIVFFCVVVILGMFVLLNVFLAIAVKSLDDARDLKAARDEHKERWKAEAAVSDESEDDREDRRRHRQYANPLVGAAEQEKEEVELQNTVLCDVDNVPLRKHLTRAVANNKSLFCLGPRNSFRKFCNNIAYDNRFESVILLLILISSALLAAEDPVNLDAQINKDLETADIFFTSVFSLEMALKIVALGFIPYITDPWNDLDAVVVLASVVSLAISSDDAAVVRVLRVFRVLRPLRAIKRAPGLRKVVSCMVVSIKTIGNVFIVTFLLTFIYAIIGVQSFKECFGRCNDPDVMFKSQCNGTFLVEDDAGLFSNATRAWSTPYFNFDNVGKGMLTLFTVSTLEGWIDVMNNAIDCTAENRQPERNNNPVAALFFVTYVILVAFFMLNIFVGYVIITFSSEGESYEAVDGLDKNQRKCLAFCLNAQPIRVHRPLYRAQISIFRFVSSKHFEWFIMAAIIGNSIVLLMAYEGMPSDYEMGLQLCNIVFTGIFTVEALLKLFALNPTGYFHDSWNFFDFIIVVGSLVDVFLSATQSSGDSGVNIGFLRLFRVARLLKLVSRGKGMKRLLWTFAKSFQSLPYVAALIMMLFFVYAVIGMQLFARTGFREDGDINEHNNFRDFFGALLLLFRCATGENWQNMMRDIHLGPPNCDPATEPGVCGSVVAVPFFCTFLVLCSFLILNLFVAVIMDNFEYLTQDNSLLGEHDLPQFIDRWSEFDPACTHRISHHDLMELLRSEEPPLGFGRKCPPKTVYSKMMRLNVPLHLDGTVDFHACLLAIVRNQLHIKTSYLDGSWEQRNYDLRKLLEKLYDPPKEQLDRMLPPPSKRNVTIGVLYAVYLLQEIYRENKRNAARQARETAEVLDAGSNEEKPQPSENEEVEDDLRLVEHAF
ncbi:voltage-dependent L type calcium channel alpha 1 [Salpingoeca rosetta]|uniref:Voltage-dependent L-type calcium channel subunit alpha n=1 Tax=Salpingoeca rosetta (strain ATCC 50818 / BSB-021) TaxID=946362 RepID=F2UMP7_SALR5|nr:voltage-dependent L type calcium channel alpha 1 [Salpingoeca rosetta]EGD78396.1 voltage-dependent L type calcium channel alpha 1 [Salpingoeca rosetta]|eukprot:XP_004989719.1 voltage-dependent L type calcium channel alpha 1 [Salpingoeca rosetta]